MKRLTKDEWLHICPKACMNGGAEIDGVWMTYEESTGDLVADDVLSVPSFATPLSNSGVEGEDVAPKRRGGKKSANG